MARPRQLRDILLRGVQLRMRQLLNEGVTLLQMSERSALSYSTIKRVWSGETCSVDTLDQLARALRVRLPEEEEEDEPAVVRQLDGYVWTVWLVASYPTEPIAPDLLDALTDELRQLAEPVVAEVVVHGIDTGDPRLDRLLAVIRAAWGKPDLLITMTERAHRTEVQIAPTVAFDPTTGEMLGANYREWWRR